MRVLTIALAATLGSSSTGWAQDLTVHFNTAEARIYELIEPLRIRCIDEQIRRGESREIAIQKAPDCLGRALLAAAELERRLRLHFPGNLTERELSFCLESVDAGESLLGCVGFFAKHQSGADATRKEMATQYEQAQRRE